MSDSLVQKVSLELRSPRAKELERELENAARLAKYPPEVVFLAKSEYNNKTLHLKRDHALLCDDCLIRNDSALTTREFWD